MFDLHEYDDYEMIGAKLAAAFGVFRKRTSPGDMETGWTQETGDQGETKMTDYIEPGRIQKLPFGEDIVIASHNRPGSNYEPFKKSNLKAGARGLGMSYEAFSGDYTGATYSSARTASLEERMGYVVLQEALVDQFLAKSWGWFMDYAVVSGALTAPGYRTERRRYLAHEWICPRWQWVDPLKDANAAEKKLRLGVTTRTAIAKETGADIEDVFDRLAWEEEQLERHNIPSILMPATAQKTTTKEPDDDNEE
jgi:lambda family phage portal protein